MGPGASHKGCHTQNLWNSARNQEVTAALRDHPAGFPYALELLGTLQGRFGVYDGANVHGESCHQVSICKGPMETLITTRHWEVTYWFPRAGWLKTTEVYSLTVLEAGSLKSRCRQSRASPEGSGGDSALCLLASGVAGNPCHSLACRCIAPESAAVVTWRPPRVSVCVSSPLPKRTLVVSAQGPPSF